jgi:RNA polymerase subunit RPABC4/transcription elongation factor Spt4
MDDNSATTTWWLWEANLDDQGIRVVIEVKTAVADGFRVDTPVAYFAECDSGSGVPEWIGTRIIIENEEFATLRAAGAIEPLAPEWAVATNQSGEPPTRGV